ncbi:MAG: acyl-CoA dehydrogenase family protein [SAR202 cluster bacterium]|jgi:acyl-CoA dehydrogenase|nr:acyl-CoA dehydrogenase family protein [SAR202 cluster bacterium]MDP6514052.1 acyl-CoA dehydrogenase family protein [SAR202 cluster bacterium]
MMNVEGQRYELPQELRMTRNVVRDYISNEIVPREQEMEHDSIFMPEDMFNSLTPTTKEMGLWCMGVPEEHGGAGLSIFAQAVLEEEMVQHAAGLYRPAYGTMGSGPPEILWQGSDYQKETYGIPTVNGERHGWFAITEPSGGSDPARAIQTRAVRDGDDWIINGSKIFISGAPWGDWGIVFARTDPQSRRGITAFIVENEWDGFELEPVPVIRAYYPAQLFFDNLRVPSRNVLGEVDNGWDLLANKLLARARIPYSAANLGVAVAAHKMAVEYSKTRETFGAPIATRQAVQWMLVDNEVEIRACRWLIWEAAWQYDAGEDFRQAASIAKVYSADILGKVVDRAIQVHGGYGVTKALPLERWYREARVRRIGEGPTEVQKMVIAREILNPGGPPG